MGKPGHTHKTVRRTIRKERDKDETKRGKDVDRQMKTVEKERVSR